MVHRPYIPNYTASCACLVPAREIPWYLQLSGTEGKVCFPAVFLDSHIYLQDLRQQALWCLLSWVSLTFTQIFQVSFEQTKSRFTTEAEVFPVSP